MLQPSNFSKYYQVLFQTPLLGGARTLAVLQNCMSVFLYFDYSLSADYLFWGDLILGEPLKANYHNRCIQSQSFAQDLLLLLFSRIYSHVILDVSQVSKIFIYCTVFWVFCGQLGVQSRVVRGFSRQLQGSEHLQWDLGEICKKCWIKIFIGRLGKFYIYYLKNIFIG